MGLVMPNAPSLDLFPGHDGTHIAVHRTGAGRPVVMIHGLASSATLNWIKYGTAEALAGAGFEAIMIDLRAHGRSEAPRDPAAYPPDVAVLDVEAVLAALDLPVFDLVGYSLGARISAMLVTRGQRPGRLVLGGMGLEGLTQWRKRRDWFLAALDRWDVARAGDPDYLSIAFMKTTKADPEALRLLLRSMDDFPAERLSDVVSPTLVLCGEDDLDNGSAPRLAVALPQARLANVPGNHMSCITKPEFGAAMAAFLAG
jgi:pimeloyl-ACP methyl ester carboxylesterase